MELFQQTKNFTKENLEYLRYRALFSKTYLKFGKNFQSKSNSLSSLLPEQDIKFNVEKLPTEYYRETKSALKAIENQSLNRETFSAPKLYHNKPKYKTEDQFMSLSADIHRRGDNQLRVDTPPYRVNQTIMYRTIAPSKHHKNCIPKKKGKNSTKNETGGQRYIPATPQTPGNKSICFDFCQEGHVLFPVATRRHFRSRGRLTCDFCESLDGIDWYCKICNKNFCTLCKHTHEMSQGSFTSYRDLMDRVFYQKTTLRHLAWRINDIKYQYENEMREMLTPKKK